MDAAERDMGGAHEKNLFPGRGERMEQVLERAREMAATDLQVLHQAPAATPPRWALLVCGNRKSMKRSAVGAGS